MALNSVTLMELLRPWRGAGITHLLALPEPGDPTPEELEGPSLSVGQPVAMAAGVNASPAMDAAPAPHKAPGAMASGAMHVAPTQASPAGHGQGRTIPSHLLPPQHGNRGNHPPAEAKQMPHSGQNLAEQEDTAALGMPSSATLPAPNAEVQTWPVSWQELWQRTRPASIVWSYPALSQDLAGQGSPDRSQLMRGLIGTLALPKGSSAFWPLTAHQDSGTCHMPAAFAGAITLLAPQVVVLMGASALPLSGFAQIGRAHV